MKQKMLRTYELAYSYLVNMLPDGLSEVDLQKYFVGDRRNFVSVNDIYEQLIYSAQNYQGMPNVIKYDQRREQIKRILKNFDLKQIRKLDVEQLYYKFRKAFKVTSRDTKQNSWRKWSKSCIESADFMSVFNDADDFRNFAKQFNYNKLAKMALPLLISTKISGIGFSLACDCLKELGFLDYPKPDVHLIEVYSQLGLSKKDPISVFEAIVDMAEFCKEIDPDVTPYKIDKIMWLICSGKFYLDGISIGKHKEDFINVMRGDLYGK